MMWNWGKSSMREPGFEPGLTARKAVVLPLDYSRFGNILLLYHIGLLLLYHIGLSNRQYLTSTILYISTYILQIGFMKFMVVSC